MANLRTRRSSGAKSATRPSGGQYCPTGMSPAVTLQPTVFIGSAPLRASGPITMKNNEMPAMKSDRRERIQPHKVSASGNTEPATRAATVVS
jgi:hypothetical protein